jgi:mannitol-1-phosphate 5-dehydrogenase
VKKIVIFGAGKIGRSFIGQVFSRSGYETVFVDIQQDIIDLINKKKEYKVIIKGPAEEELLIQNVRAIHASQQEILSGELVNADLVAVSVGKAGLMKILDPLAKGISNRYQKNPGYPLDIIIAENIRNAAAIMYGRFRELLGDHFPINQYIGLIETSIGKMVPIMRAHDLSADPLQIFAEPYNTLILDRKGFRNPVPDIPWLAPKDNIRAWVDRKSFIHNLGHASAAYLGYLHQPGKQYLYEVLSDENLMEQVRMTMEESARILMQMYPDEFTREGLSAHINDLLNRFKNVALKDSVFRVGSDLQRKLGHNDRLVAPIMKGHSLNLPVDRLLYVLVSGFYFRATNEQGNMHPDDVEFYNNFIPEIGILMERICKFDPVLHRGLFTKARKYCEKINISFNPVVKIT